MSHNIDFVAEYHERTKHHPGRYAPALGYMDWATQPDPFRRYDGAPQIDLEHPPIDDRVSYDSLYRHGSVPPANLNRQSISRLFYDSLAISAWKQAPGTPPWSLRVNPSSGCLHPTEGYLIVGPVEDLSTQPAVYHYCPLLHCLEQRATLAEDDWNKVAGQLPDNAVLLALTSIYWRESWKYGERAFRYCHHDVGHAIGTIAFAAATLGWQARMNGTVSDDQLAKLLGVHHQRGMEAEHPDCLLVLHPAGEESNHRPAFEFPPELIERISTGEFAGKPNQLSSQHHSWPIIEEVSEATRYMESLSDDHIAGTRTTPGMGNAKARIDRTQPAQGIIRQRRSAVSMDGRTAISSDDFYLMLQRTMPGKFPFDALPWKPRVSLALFVHRVTEMSPGLYLLARGPSHEQDLRGTLRGEFSWTKPAGCPKELPFALLREGDFRETAKLVSCHQDIAADGAFALGMLVHFQPSLDHLGPSYYPRLYWETGLIGQVLYLEAEAAGIRSTGIGCFFDDAMHEVLGINGRQWQSLYHFTVGGQVEDLRIQTIPPYEHLK